MKIGYPCINRTLDCRGNKTFRLKSYSEQRLIQTVENNLNCLNNMIDFNIKNNLLFFRITSDLVPFASHSVCTFNWQEYFSKKLENIGKIIKQNKIRISMHPDQFIVLNSKNKEVVNRSIKELFYHAQILDLMKLDYTAKIQLHVGGAYGDKKQSIQRFINNYSTLNQKIKNRLVIENDDRIYSIKECLHISDKTDIPILFDVFHHSIINNNEPIKQILHNTKDTWQKKDGIPLADYSSQEPGEKTGKHAQTINLDDFEKFIKESRPFDFDIMLEIKDKEKSAIKAYEIAKKDKRILKVKN